ncbi:hypothetical protein AXK56_14955 [Tsukamurella pulmonis]|uniref:DUF1731 domain-containing protein n=1 Tax=Tsukamurella pulmonis TaxID=47312 RepID=A0A1H1FVJ5_9ACTN|nr:DUF1731 domain-containing protein [Tsukamurella pulmonis]KXO87708.1 hypothetical protein AXK56_14955 [Tsukamurella pulmonis]SDR04993.1 hypothetical protein SAMN04489765_2945 [Tsukamurella pulmonis]SUP18341.1 Epimerase family protein SA0724 [Tsukamurella pulmonis]
MATVHRSSGFIALPARALWDVLVDLERLPRWQPFVTQAPLRDPVGLGARLDWVPDLRGAWVHRRFAAPAVVTEFAPERALALTQDEPAGTTVLRWTLRPAEGGTVVEQSVRSDGASGPLFDRMVARRFAADADTSLARLSMLAGPPRAADPLHVVIAGGTGALGRRVAADLVRRGHAVTILTRSIRADLPYPQVTWDGRTVGAWAAVLDGPNTAVINLAGKLVDCRPTAANIAALTASRVDATRALVEAARGKDVRRWVQASTTAIWSDAGERWCTEDTPLPEPGLPQMTGVARPWEEAARDAGAAHRTILRTSIVLDTDSPAMAKMVGVTKAFLGGSLGDGRQWFSWIHRDDWLAVVRAGLGIEPGVDLPDGVVVAAAPNPVRNADLMRALRRHLHRPPAPPTPAPLLALGAIGMRSDPALGLTGRHATSTVLPAAGFAFAHPTLDGALDDLLG